MTLNKSVEFTAEHAAAVRIPLDVSYSGGAPHTSDVDRDCCSLRAYGSWVLAHQQTAQRDIVVGPHARLVRGAARARLTTSTIDSVDARPNFVSMRHRGAALFGDTHE